MRYVIDSSVAFKWVVPEVDSDKAIRLRDNVRGAVHQLLSPDIYPVEVGHALTRAERQKRLTPPAGWAAWLTVMADPPHLHASYPIMPRAFDISSRMRIGIYDCLYVALAEQENCELVTADHRLIANLQPQFPFVVALTSLP
jgi:predicted nucleic acid-binding protein